MNSEQDQFSDLGPVCPDEHDDIDYSSVGLKRRQILIVEDDPVIQSLLEEHLTSHGFRCRCAFTAEAALAMLEYVDPELVLLDLELPKANGTAFLKAVKDWLPAGRKLPQIIVLSSHNDKCIVDYILDSGAVAFIAKPFDPEKLITLVHDYSK